MSVVDPRISLTLKKLIAEPVTAGRELVIFDPAYCCASAPGRTTRIVAKLTAKTAEGVRRRMVSGKYRGKLDDHLQFICLAERYVYQRTSKANCSYHLRTQSAQRMPQLSNRVRTHVSSIVVGRQMLILQWSVREYVPR